MSKRINTHSSRSTSSHNRSVPWKGIGVLVVVIVAVLAITHIAFRHLVSTQSTFAFLKTKRALVAENTALQMTLQQYSADEAELSLLKSENDSLKSELERTDHSKGILASVLFPPGRSLYDTFVIDAGSAEGIQESMEAYAFGSIALGTVTHVETHRSIVTLFSSHGNEISGSVAGNDTALTLVGRGSGEYEIHMPRDIHFDQGQIIAEQSTQAHVLATILEITADPRDPFQVIRAKAPVNLQALKWVIIE